MPTEKVSRQRVMEARAKALATLLLTRRPGADVEDVGGGDLGIDLSVTLGSENKPGPRRFGVGLGWALEPVTADGANDALGRNWRQLTDCGPFPFPIAVFLFTLQDNGAWYSWVAEPVVSARKQAQLPLRPEPDCRPLAEDSLGGLFALVDAWFDAHYAGTSASVPGVAPPNEPANPPPHEPGPP